MSRGRRRPGEAGAVTLAVNPTSGRGRGRPAAVAAHQALTAAGLRVRPVFGRDADGLEQRVRDDLACGSDALVVVGGDGMVHLGVNAVAATQTALGIVPAGTGNDIARGLGLPVGDLPACIDLLVQHLTSQAAARPVDAVRCTRGPAGAVRGDERWFAGVLGAGFDAVVNERANGWRWPRGHLRYDLAIVRELPVFTPRTYRLTLDGEQWATKAMLVAIGNGPSYGGGMRVCPDAIFDDGLMDVLVVAPMSRTRFMALYPRVYSGTHVSHPSVQVRRAASLRIECDGIVAYADGERLWPLPLHLDVVPHALHVLAPGRVPADNPTDTLAYPRPEAEGGAPTP